jgi:hypothetical protein
VKPAERERPIQIGEHRDHLRPDRNTGGADFSLLARLRRESALNREPTNCVEERQGNKVKARIIKRRPIWLSPCLEATELIRTSWPGAARWSLILGAVRANLLQGLSGRRKLPPSRAAGSIITVTKHVALRAEYRGFVYNRPDFQLAALNSNVTAHAAQPSAGIVIRF